MKIIKLFCSIDHIWMKRIQRKNHIESYRNNKVSLSFCNDKKYIYLKMNIVDYHIYGNVLVNHR